MQDPFTWKQAFYGLGTVMSTILAVLGKMTMSKHKALISEINRSHDAVKKLNEDLHEHRLHVAENYPTHGEVNEKFSEMRDTLKSMDDKLDRLIERRSQDR